MYRAESALAAAGGALRTTSGVPFFLALPSHDDEAHAHAHEVASTSLSTRSLLSLASPWRQITDTVKHLRILAANPNVDPQALLSRGAAAVALEADSKSSNDMSVRVHLHYCTAWQ